MSTDWALEFIASEDVNDHVDGNALFVTIERPQQRNPLSLGVLDSIRDIFETQADNGDLSVAVLTGSGGKAFASGGDLKELKRYRDVPEAAAFSQLGKRALDAIRKFPVPVVARINGVALGGGAELALACDLRYASQGARIGFIHGRLKIAPSWGGGNDLVELLGASAALQLLATARILDSAEAVARGLFNQASASDEAFEGWFDEQLAGLRANPPQVMRAFKSLSIANRNCRRLEADRLETDHFSDVWVHDDHWEAVDRMEKATP